MKRALFVATLTAISGLAALSTRALPAQQPAAGTNVAIIDLAAVFKNHDRFKMQMEEVKKEIEAFEAFYRQEGKKLEGLAEELKALKPGSPEFKAKEEQGAQMQANLQLQLQLKRKEFLEREARVRYNAYQEIVGHVGRFAERNGIQLVIRFSGDAVDPNNPQSVQMGLMRPVVYHRERDITNFIVSAINQGQAPANVGSAPQIPRR